MDGTQCYNAALGCAPYYQQGKHAACRKYCEFTQFSNDTTHTCDECSSVDAASAIFGKCVDFKDCEDPDKFDGVYQQPKSGFFRFLGYENVLRKSCTVNQYNASKARRVIGLQNSKFIPLSNYTLVDSNLTGNVTTYRAACGDNYVPRIYQYVATG